MSSAVQSLILAAKEHGVELNFDRIMLDYALKENQEPDAQGLCRIATGNNLQAKHINSSWRDIRNMGSAFPVIAQLKNKRFVLITKYDRNENEEFIEAIDPKSEDKKALKIKKEKFLKAWSRRLVLIKANHESWDDQNHLNSTWLSRTFAQQKTILLQTSVIAVLINLLAVAPIALLSSVFDNRNYLNGYQSFTVLGMVFIICLILSGLLEHMRRRLSQFFTTKLDVQLNLKLFDSIFVREGSEYHHGEKGIHALRKLEIIKSFASKTTFNTIFSVTGLCIFIPFLALLNTHFLIISVLFSLLIALTALITLDAKYRQQQQQQNFQSEKQSLLNTSQAHLESIKGLTMEASLRHKWEKLSVENIRAGSQAHRFQSLYKVIIGTLRLLMLASIFVYGTYHLATSHISLGILFGGLLAAHIIANCSQRLSINWHEYRQFRKAIDALANVMNVTNENKSGLKSPDIQGEIEFRHLTYRLSPSSHKYSDENHLATKVTDKALLRNFSFTLKPGQNACILGPSTELSSLFPLLQGLYRLTEGSILLDGFDIDTLDKTHLRNCIGHFSGQCLFTPGTIRDNLGQAMPNASPEHLHWALRMSTLLDDLSRLPKGMDTEVDDQASGLADATKTKIALAKVLLRNSKVLLIQDAFSHLSLQDQINIRQNMTEISAGKTFIFTTNNLEQAQFFDQILVIDDSGRLLEHGDHESLIKANRWYTKQWTTLEQYKASLLFQRSTLTEQAFQGPDAKTDKTSVELSSLSSSESLSSNSDTVKRESETDRTKSSLNEIESSPHTDKNLDHVGKHSQHDKGSSSEEDGSDIKDSQVKENDPLKAQAKPHTLDSLKLKELGERLHRHNLQAQEARIKAEQKLEEVKQNKRPSLSALMERAAPVRNSVRTGVEKTDTDLRNSNNETKTIESARPVHKESTEQIKAFSQTNIDDNEDKSLEKIGSQHNPEALNKDDLNAHILDLDDSELEKFAEIETQSQTSDNGEESDNAEELNDSQDAESSSSTIKDSDKKTTTQQEETLTSFIEGYLKND